MFPVAFFLPVSKTQLTLGPAKDVLLCYRFLEITQSLMNEVSLLWTMLTCGMLQHFAGCNLEWVLYQLAVLRLWEDMQMCLVFTVTLKKIALLILWLEMEHQIPPLSRCSGSLWIALQILKLCGVEYSWRIVKEVLKPVIVANLFMIIWFQNLVDQCHFVGLKICFLGPSLMHGVVRFMGKLWQRFARRPLQLGTHVYYHSFRHLLTILSIFIHKRACFLQFAPEVVYHAVSQ